MVDPAQGPRIRDAARARTDAVVAALRAADPASRRGRSGLPGWSRLTLAAHLRYGAAATGRMTLDALAGRATAFYPGGRAAQRPGTLAPGRGEPAGAVVEDLAARSAELDATWGRLSRLDWATPVREPAEHPDLGETTVALLALLRLTEVEVHGTDLDLGLGGWSETFVALALPARLAWLPTRRSNHRSAGRVDGSWLLQALDGPCWRVSARGDVVASEPADPGTTADALIAGPSRDLLALLLGRAPVRPLRLGGDERLARAFGRAFPGP